MKAGKQRNRLRVLRAERGITQIDLAIKAGVAQSAYWRIENGYDIPSDAVQARLARVLKVEISELGIAPSKQAMEQAS